MNIAICSAGELFGGVERQILDLCRFYPRQGLPVPLVVLFHEHKLAAKLREQGVEPVVLHGRSRYDWSLVGDVQRLLGERAVDVVHVHGYKGTIAGALAARRLGLPVVKTEHGKLEGTPAQPLVWLKSHLNFGIEQAVTRRHVDHVCYVTDDIARFYDGRHRGLARSTVHNGIDPLDRADRPRPEDLPAGTVNVGLVGRVSEVKNIPLAVDALARPEVPGEVHLQVIGTGPLEQEVRRRAADAGVADRVHLLGFRENVYDYLAHLDLLLMPSRHEGLPYTLLEAWSLGCPLAVSRVGGLAEVLTDGPGATLFAVGDTAAIAAALAAARPAGAADRPVPGPCPLTLDTMGGAYLEIMTSLSGGAAA